MIEHGKIALVVGAARGIGFNIARRLARDGVHVFLGDNNESLLREAVDDLKAQGLQAASVVGDLMMPYGGQAMVQAVVAAAGRIDILVNNARAGARRGLLDEDEINWDLTLGVMMKAPYFTSQAAIAQMIRQGDGGAIVNIASVAANLICGESPSYHAAKAGLNHMTRYLAVAAGPHGIRVNSVIPGFIVKDEHRARYESDDNFAYREKTHAAHPLRRSGTSDEVADAVAYLCSSGATYVTGTALVVDGGLTIQDQWAVLAAIPPVR